MIVVVLALAAGGVFLFTRDDDEGPGDEIATRDDGGGPGNDESDDTRGADSPDAVVTAFLEAAADDDCEGMVELLTDNVLGDQSRREALADCEDDDDPGGELGELEPVGEAEVDGSEATAELEGGSGLLVTMTLVEDDGRWLIDDLEFDYESQGEGPEDEDEDDVDVAEDTDVTDDTDDTDVTDDEIDTELEALEAEGVVWEFTDLAWDEDCAGMVELVTESFREGQTVDEAVAQCEASPQDLEAIRVMVPTDETRVEGDTAHVPVESIEDASVTGEFVLIREGDTWLIDDVTVG